MWWPYGWWYGRGRGFGRGFGFGRWYGYGYGYGFGRGYGWRWLWGSPFIASLTRRGYTYIGPCRSGIGPFAYYMTPTGQIVHAWQLLGSPYSSYYTTTPVFPPAYPFTTPYTINPQDELKYLQEEKRMLEQQLKDLEKRLDELSRKE
ncbi:MAG: DUF5320 domain-containing protein [Candidatus Odinarchaeota archaeon]|nr:DUF5320 domain-containing protein [Candidatus Odinarchaeota archaeon]